MKYLQFLSGLFSILFITTSAVAQEPCQLRTQTQGGWGTVAHGNNPGVYRDANFDDAFPDGLTVGCADGYTLHLSSSYAVQEFLPCGGTPAALTQDYVDPTCIGNVLSGQLVALTVSVFMDLNDPDFGEADANLADAVVNNGTFEGWTVVEVWNLANDIFGGCSDEYSYSTMVEVLSMINENYVDGNTNNGNLDCEEDCPDTEDPVLVSYPGNWVFECSEEILFEAPVWSDEDDDLDIDFMEDVSGDFCEQIIERTWIATDDCGNSSFFIQTITVLDTTPPELLGVPEDETINCDEDVQDAIVAAIDLCDDDLIITLEAVTIDLECGYQLTRTWSTEDDCGNYVEATQVVNVTDNVPPELSEYPEDMVLDCDGDVPPPPVITAIDNCDPDVTVDFDEVIGEGGDGTDCLLTTPDMPEPSWSLVIFGLPNDQIYFHAQNDMSLVLTETDGVFSALISGNVVNTDNPNGGFYVNLSLIDGVDWETWDNMPWENDYKDDLGLAGDNYLDWLYFIIDETDSYLEGWGDYEGSYLPLTHAPSTLFYGYQLGVAANNVNSNYGNGGWFNTTGTFVDSSQGINETISSFGDFAFDQNCCDQGDIVRTWTATDCSGNTETHTQTISFEGEGIIQEAPPAFSASCAEDLTGDGKVDTQDMITFLTYLGCIGNECNGDLNGDDMTSMPDILILLSKFGSNCE